MRNAPAHPAPPPGPSRLQHLLAIVLAGGVLFAVVGLGASAGTGSLKRQPGEVAAGQRASARLLAGIPQAGIVLGRPAAPVRIVEFADLQCPFCARFSNKELPAVVRDQVRSGKARIELRLLDILDRGGPGDSARMAAAAYAAQRRNRMWNLVDIIFNNQSAEGSGYATDAYLRRMASAVPGLDPAAVLRGLKGRGARAALAQSRALADQYDVHGTPTILVGRTGHRLTRVGDATAAAVGKAVAKAGTP